MKDNQVSLKVQAENNFSLDTETNLFYDWFCSDKSLAARGKKLAGQVRKIMTINAASASKSFDEDKVYVFFKNTCPMVGKVYDDFRICDLETGDVLFTVTKSLGYDSCFGASSLWARQLDGSFQEIVEAGTWQEVLDNFKN